MCTCWKWFKKLQTFDSSHFIGQSDFNNDRSKKYIIVQPSYYALKRIGNTEKVVSWKSKGLPEQKLTTPTTNDNSLFP